MESCNYDEEEYEKQHEEWTVAKRKADEHSSVREEASRKAEEAWLADVERFETGKASLRVQDMDVAEDAVKASLSEHQMMALVKAAQGNPAAIIYALGKSPQRLAELAKQGDLIKFAASVALIEKGVKVMPRKRVEPETTRTGNARAVSSDKQLERLEKEAEKTGDRTKLIQYRKAKAKA